MGELEPAARVLFRKAVGVRDAVRRYGVNGALFHAMVVIPRALLQLALIRMQRCTRGFESTDTDSA